MEYKILINGKSPALIKDFFLHTGGNFKYLSTSDIWEDIANHIEVFRPDAYMCFYDQPDDNMISQLQSIKNNAKYSGVNFVIVGDQESCDTFYKKAPFISALMIKKPTTTQAMEDLIKRYLDEKSRARAEAEAAKAKEEAAARAAAEAAAKEAEEAARASAAPAGLGISLDDLKRSFDTPAKKRILIVDDDRNVLKMLKTALSADYDITSMVNGKMAEKYLETKTADLILLDYEMPEEPGPEVFRKIRADYRTKNIPVVFLTGVAEEEKIREVLAMRPRGYLLKPIDMKKLRGTIEDILG